MAKNAKTVETRKDSYNELVFILDRSGSMAGLESDTIGGYNGVLKRQRELSGNTVVTTVLFDDKYELLHDRIRIGAVAPLTHRDYYTRGCTALLDAIGRTISKMDNAISNMRAEARPENVLVVITTDGYENASREYTAERVREMIRAREGLGWEFLFLGANIDAVETAAHYGIPRRHAVDFVPDSRGVGSAFESIAYAASAVMEGNMEVLESGEWAESARSDYEERA